MTIVNLYLYLHITTCKDSLFCLTVAGKLGCVDNHCSKKMSISLPPSTPFETKKNLRQLSPARSNFSPADSPKKKIEFRLPKFLEKNLFRIIFMIGNLKFLSGEKKYQSVNVVVEN